MPNLILSKIAGVSTEVEHHRIAKIIKLASTKAKIKRLEAKAKPKELTEAKAEVLQLDGELTSEGVSIRVSMLEYNHSVGLIMGRELWLSASPKDLEDVNRKVLLARGVT